MLRRLHPCAFPTLFAFEDRNATRVAWYQSTLLCQGTAVGCVFPSVFELIEAFQVRHIQAAVGQRLELPDGGFRLVLEGTYQGVLQECLSTSIGGKQIKS